MIKVLQIITLLAVGIIASLTSSPAYAANIIINSVDQPKGNLQIVVIPKDGRWDHVAREDIKFTMRVSAKFRGVHGKGGINRLKIQQYEQIPQNRPLMFEKIFHPAKRKIGHTADVSFSADRLTQRIRNKAIDQCNKLIPRGGVPDKDHRLYDVFTVPLRIVVDGRRSVGFLDIDPNGESYIARVKNRDIAVAVICKKQPGYEKPHRNASITSVKLKYTVIGEGTTCPIKVRRKVTARGTRSGLFKVHLRGGGNKLGEIDVRLEQQPNGDYVGHDVEEINMATTDAVHRIVVPGTAVKSPAETLKVPCGRPEIKKVTLKVKNLNISGANECPMKVRVTATYETTRPGTFLALLERSGVKEGGEQWVETLTSKEKNGKYIAKIVKTHNFEDDFVYPVKYRARAPGKPRLNTDWSDANVKCPFKVKTAKLKFKPEAKMTCPKTAATIATFQTTAPGKVRFQFKSESGDVSDWFTVKAKLKDGKYVARYQGRTSYDKSFSANMSVIAAGPPSVKSSPATLNITCGVRSN